MSTNEYQVSNPEDIAFHWEHLDLNMDAVFRPSIGIHFSPSYFNDVEMVSKAQNSLLVDEEQGKENSPPLLTTRFYEQSTHPAC